MDESHPHPTADEKLYRVFPQVTTSIITDNETRVEALRNAEEMIDAYLKTASEASWPVPEPKGRMAFA